MTYDHARAAAGLAAAVGMLVGPDDPTGAFEWAPHHQVTS